MVSIIHDSIKNPRIPQNLMLSNQFIWNKCQCIILIILYYQVAVYKICRNFV